MIGCQRATFWLRVWRQILSDRNWSTATTAPTVNLLRIEENLSAAHLRLASGTTVENLQRDDCVRRYDREHLLLYGPAVLADEGYGVPFVWEQYVAIAQVMRSCKGKGYAVNQRPLIFGRVSKSVCTNSTSATASPATGKPESGEFV